MERNRLGGGGRERDARWVSSQRSGPTGKNVVSCCTNLEDEIEMRRNSNIYWSTGGGLVEILKSQKR